MAADNESNERPASGRSNMTRLTGGMTGGAQTQISGGRSTSTAMITKALELETALKLISNRNTQLISFIKFDTTLGREQNVELAKESSLANTEKLQVRGGVKLTQFHPQKRRTDKSLEEDTEDSFCKDCSKESGSVGDQAAKEGSKDTAKNRKKVKVEKKMNWEEKLAQRKREEAAGLRDPLVPANIMNGGPYKQEHKISRNEYQRVYSKAPFSIYEQTLAQPMEPSKTKQSTPYDPENPNDTSNILNIKT